MEILCQGGNDREVDRPSDRTAKPCEQKGGSSLVLLSMQSAYLKNPAKEVIAITARISPLVRIVHGGGRISSSSYFSAEELDESPSIPAVLVWGITLAEMRDGTQCEAMVPLSHFSDDMIRAQQRIRARQCPRPDFHSRSVCDAAGGLEMIG